MTLTKIFGRVKLKSRREAFFLLLPAPSAKPSQHAQKFSVAVVKVCEATAEENFLLAQNDGFWCRKVAFGEEKVSPFSRKLALLANVLMTGNFEDLNTDIDILKYVAFMNLNKRGGFTKCHQRILREYVQKYRDLIEEEIKIISPDIIVCCGVGIRDDLLKKYVHIPDEDIPVLEVYHPSYAISYENFLSKLKTEFEAIK